MRVFLGAYVLERVILCLKLVKKKTSKNIKKMPKVPIYCITLETKSSQGACCTHHVFISKQLKNCILSCIKSCNNTSNTKQSFIIYVLTLLYDKSKSEYEKKIEGLELSFEEKTNEYRKDRNLNSTTRILTSILNFLLKQMSGKIKVMKKMGKNCNSAFLV